MLDIRLIRQDPEAMNRALKRRHPDLSVDTILELDQQRVALLQEEEILRSERNRLSKEIGQLRSQGQNADALQAQTKDMADRIKAIEAQKDSLAQQQEALVLDMPNTPFDDVPEGRDETANVEVRRWGDEFKTRAQGEVPHWDLAAALGMVDFERGVKVAQSRFLCLTGQGAKLERALIDLMLSTHTAKTYTEVMPPFLVNAKAMQGTGQLPKFAQDMFACRDDELYLAPTAEVPVTNLYADEILDAEDLPIHLSAFTPCFRREAGSAGRDTRGLMRLHQFNKVELVKFCTPETSQDEHEALLHDAEAILQLLELPYRVMALCTGDMGFSAAKCYDLEVWLPSQQCYREISSCSNFGDFQARRANIKYRPAAGEKPQYVHTLNGSGLAVGRTMAAILENYQQADGRVFIPSVLQAYFAQQTEFSHHDVLRRDARTPVA